MKINKKLIEVALPLEAINKASAREKSIRHGHPSTLHLWWARRPLAAARAVIFAQMVDDPSAHPDLFPTERAQEKERKRLFKIIEELVQWESTTNEDVLQKARDEIWQSWRYTCTENADHPKADLFDRHKLPAFHDPFAGGGALPLEAQRLGLDAYASDLNPVAVLINKAMIEIPPKFAGKPPVNPEAKKKMTLFPREWRGAQGLAEDVRYYGEWIRNEAEKRIGHLYPKVEITSEMIKERPDLKKYLGKRLTTIAWIWARTVKSPNPAFSHIDVPLTSTFMLSSRSGNEAFVEPVINENGYRFRVRVGKPKDAELTKYGTKFSGANFRCLMSDATIDAKYIRDEAKAGRLGEKLMSIVVESETGQLFLPATDIIESNALSVKPGWKPDVEFFQQALGFRVGNYGMTKWSDLFTSRQLVALTTFSDLVQEAHAIVKKDAKDIVLFDPLSTSDLASKTLAQGGIGNIAYADAIGVYLSLAVGRCANYWSSLTAWGDNFIVQTFGRQAVSMVWDHAEGNPFSDSTGNWSGALEWIGKVIDNSLPALQSGSAIQGDAQTQSISLNKIVSTDPPYYDNIGYADLSDFFYVWLRRSQRSIFQDLFATLAVPKAEELVATPARHGNKEKAERFFLNGMTKAIHRLAEQTHPAFPVTIYYAFKQTESDSADGITSSGWETFLDAVILADFAISGTWPVRTERSGGFRNRKRSSLASSIVLVCRPRDKNGPNTTRRDFITTLKAELPLAVTNLQYGNIAPVDLAQAAIGPGMAIYTRYSKVLDAEGNPLSVRDALTLINQTLDEVLTEQEGDFDADTRWALTWFEQSGFTENDFGVAEILSKAKNTSVSGMVEAGILASSRGKVRLLKPDELPDDWDPENDKRLTNWEMVHHLIKALESGGEQVAAKLVAKLGSKAETARELCYRLYSLCERKKRATEAQSYNALVQSWPEMTRLVQEGGRPVVKERTLLDEMEQE